jgi:molybdenum cofactor cytidylyltransferase
MHAIGIIVLAAGGSTRMGSPKQLLPFGKSTLLRQAAETAVATGFAPVVVVLGAEAEACAEKITGLPVTTVVNPGWSEGMGTSLRIGMQELEKLAPNATGVLIMLHDQPRISPGILQKLAGSWDGEPHSIAAAFYGGAAGVPAVFGRDYFSELSRLDGPGGAKSVLRRHSAAVTLLELPEAMDDIDSPEDYRRLSLSAGRDGTAGAGIA